MAGGGSGRGGGGGDTLWLVGRHPVAEALANQPERAGELLYAPGGRGAGGLAPLLELARAAGIRIRQVERGRLETLAGGAAHQGVALSLAGAAYANLAQVAAAARLAGPRALVILADHLQDPHNLGAVLRSAAAAGAQGVVIPKDRACPLSPVVAKAAAGALDRVPVARVTNLTEALLALKEEAGLWGLAAVAHGAPPPWTLALDLPLALVLGAEHGGVGRRILAACELKASLPLAAGAESLNASVAAGVFLFEIVRQRG